MVWISPNEMPDWLVQLFSDSDYWYRAHIAVPPSADSPAGQSWWTSAARMATHSSTYPRKHSPRC